MGHPGTSLLHTLEKTLAAFRAEGTKPSPPAPGTPPDALAGLAAWMDPRHTLLLRAVLDSSQGVRQPGAGGVLGGVHRILDELRRETRLKFAGFRETWEARLEARALLPFLRRNQWIASHPSGGFVLAGKGTRKEARMLYLQLMHDAATDCARQWASLAGRLQAYQASFASEWHAAALRADDDATRLLPVLEASLRDAEFETWKSLRLSLGDVAGEAFVRAAGRWEHRVSPDETGLARGILPPWAASGLHGNGFSGLMRALSSLAEKLSLAMLDHYERKWDLFLRGLPETESAANKTE